MKNINRSVSALALISAAGFVSLGAGAAAQEHQFVHASLNPSNHIDYPVNMDFVERVERLSEGRITFRVFEGGVLGDEREMIEQIRTGTISTARLTPAALSAVCDGMSILNLPFLFEDGMSLLETARSDEFAGVCDDVLLDEGIRPLEYWWMGVRDVYTTQPVESVADIQGLKLRTWQDPYILAAWRRLGAIPTPISFNELYTALQTGTVDGAEGWAASYNSQSFYEVAPHLTRIGYVHIGSVLAISEASWNNLPDDLRDVVRQAAEENAQFAYDTFSELQDQIYELSAELATVHEVPDLDEWIAATASVLQQFADDNSGAAGDLVLDLINN